MTRFQLFTFLLQSQIGIGILAFPYDLHKAAGADGWISVLLAGAAIQLLLVIYVRLMNRYPQMSLYELAPKLLGRWAGGGLNLLFLIHFILAACVILLLEMVLIQNWIFPFYNPWLMLVANLILLSYFAKERIQIIVRYHTLVSFFILVMLGLMFFGLNHLDIRYLLPIGREGWQEWLLGMRSSILTFLGFELFLIVSSEVKRTEGKGLMAPVMWANGCATLFYLIILLICFMHFSPESIDKIPQPVPYYLNGITMPIIERFDLLFLSFWLVKVTATLIGYVYAAGMGLKILFKSRESKWPTLILSLMICVAGAWWNSGEMVSMLISLLENVSFFVIAAPILLFIVALMKHRRKEHRA
ncbi:GerAB/ArcD/ProY family transporter [Paenibacillus sp. GCM10023252]|uniref:GerAB/ArcD/ProY family transporter n=1 Tax=Paenibacillus sp. GCM10023252 TaxID=3252649 RepID=UPI00362139E2